MLLLALLTAFVAVAFVYALRFPSGRLFPTRRDKLLRKVGPLADGQLRDLKLRGYTAAGGTPRLLLAAVYTYQVKEQEHEITLPTDSTRLPGAGIRAARTAGDGGREVPERLTLDDGTLLEGHESIRQHYLDRLRERSPQVKVIYHGRRPALSTVRDWR
ncbi:MAG TPA: hypothetical protein VNT60_02430 [Deinococcales bacterium]|nr:hypothetical protein [Deinococcales bacterium]